jgi:hypothetical protein
MERPKKSFFSIVSILAIFILAVIFFWPNLTQPGIAFTPTVGTNDLTDQQYAFRFFLSQSLREKKLPLWSSRASNGFPFLAESQMGFFYPLNLFLSFLSVILATNLNILLSFFLTGLFTYFYLIELDLSGLSSLFGAIVFCFSGFLLSHQVNLNILNVVTWFPLQCLLVEKMLARCKKPNPTSRDSLFIIHYSLFMGLTFALQFLAGHPETAFYIIFFLLGYVLFRKAKLMPFFLMAVFLGIALAAVQLLPTWEFVRNSTRAWDLLPQVNFPIRSLISFILPFYFWNPEITPTAFDQNGWPFYERYGYVGILPLLFAFFTTIWWFSNLERPLAAEIKERIFLVGFFLATLFISLFLSFGNNTPFGFLFNLFLFRLFRAPVRFLLLVDFSIAVLAAVGFDELGSRGWGLGVRVKNFFSKRFTSYTLIILVFFDLFSHGRKLYQIVPAQKWYQVPKVVGYFKKYAPEARIAHENYYFPRKKTFLEKKDLPQTLSNLRNLLPGFNNLLYDLDVVTVAADYAGLKIAHFNKMESDLVFNLPSYPTLGGVGLTDDYFRLARLMGVTHLVFAKEIVSDKVEKVYSVGFKNGQDPINVYRLRNFLPLAFVVYSAEFHPSDLIVKKKIVEGTFDPEKTVLISAEKPAHSEKLEIFEAKLGKARVVKKEEARVKVEVEAEDEGFLVLLNAFYPGWEAFIDGREIKIFRANYAFWAIPVEKGSHNIIFSYQPESFKLGILISTASLIFFLVAIAYQRFITKSCR